MKLICYFPLGNDEAVKRLQRVIAPLVMEDYIEVYHSIETLLDKFRQPFQNLNIAVFLAARQKDLLEILAAQHLLRDIRIVLILPDSKEATIYKGHQLYPRFIGYVDDDFKDVGAVLEKMIEFVNFKKGNFCRLSERE